LLERARQLLFPPKTLNMVSILQNLSPCSKGASTCGDDGVFGQLGNLKVGSTCVYMPMGKVQNSK